VSPERLVHHELCFGCGRTNLFGLLMDLERVGEGHVRGRGFVKQDHQGPDRGLAHEGVVLAALSDTMALACGPEMRATRVELELHEPVPVGAFLDVEARAGEPARDGVKVTAVAHVEARAVAVARGLYTRP
jgi:acyl-coenzyme A thioesterase PaaI-like protein